MLTSDITFNTVLNWFQTQRTRDFPFCFGTGSITKKKKNSENLCSDSNRQTDSFRINSTILLQTPTKKRKRKRTLTRQDQSSHHWDNCEFLNLLHICDVISPEREINGIYTFTTFGQYFFNSLMSSDLMNSYHLF